MREGNNGRGLFQVFVGLCPDCDKIHLILEFDGEEVFNQGVPDEVWDAMFSGHAQLVRKRDKQGSNAN